MRKSVIYSIRKTLKKASKTAFFTIAYMLILTGCSSVSIEEVVSSKSVENTEITKESYQQETTTKTEKPKSEEVSEAVTKQVNENTSEAATEPKKEESTSSKVSESSAVSNNTSNSSSSVNVPKDIPGESPFAVHGALRVDGTHLSDTSGNAFQLRGVSTHGIAWFPQFINYDAFLTLRDDWGANCVRLAMYTYEGGGYCVSSQSDKDNLLNLIDTGVNAATELGMYVIVDWHVLNERDPNTYIDQAKDFFEKVSSKYAGYSNVLYEICNEPNGGVSWSQIKSYAETIIPIIKKNSPNAIIIVGTPTWSQDVDIAATDPIRGYEGIMYALHFYADTHRESLRSKMENALSYGLPIFVTEFGVCDASGSGANNYTEGGNWISKLDSYGISYCIWNLANKNETSSLVSSGCSKTAYWSEADLSDSGRWYRNVLRERMGITADITATIPSASSCNNQNNSDNNNQQNQNNSNNQSNNQSVSYQAPVLSNSEASASNGNVNANLSTSNNWSDSVSCFYQLNLSLKNSGNEVKEGWQVTATFSGNIKISQNWNCIVAVSGNTLTVTPAEYNSSIAAQGQQEAGIIISSDADVTITSLTVE